MVGRQPAAGQVVGVECHVDRLERKLGPDVLLEAGREQWYVGTSTYLRRRRGETVRESREWRGLSTHQDGRHCSDKCT